MIVVADTSVLLNLAFLRQEHLLPLWFETVLVPEAVAREFARLGTSVGRFARLQLPSFCQIASVTNIPTRLASEARLDAGETEALTLMIERKADAILLDESAARSVAKELGLEVIGTLGLLLRAKKCNLISEVAPLLRKLIVEGHFRVSPALVHATLQRAGELP